MSHRRLRGDADNELKPSDLERSSESSESPKIPHTEGLDEAIDKIHELLCAEVHHTAMEYREGKLTEKQLGEQQHESYEEAKAKIKALLAETKKPPKKELSSSTDCPTEVSASIVPPHIDEALDKLLRSVYCLIDKDHNVAQPEVEYDDAKAKLIKLIESTVLSVIETGIFIDPDKTRSEIVGDLRAKQRSKLGRLMGK